MLAYHKQGSPMPTFTCILRVPPFSMRSSQPENAEALAAQPHEWNEIREACFVFDNKHNSSYFKHEPQKLHILVLSQFSERKETFTGWGRTIRAEFVTTRYFLYSRSFFFCSQTVDRPVAVFTLRPRNIALSKRHPGPAFFRPLSATAVIAAARLADCHD